MLGPEYFVRFVFSNKQYTYTSYSEFFSLGRDGARRAHFWYFVKGSDLMLRPGYLVRFVFSNK